MEAEHNVVLRSPFLHGLSHDDLIGVIIVECHRIRRVWALI